MPFTEMPHSGREFSNKKPDIYEDIYEKFHGSELNLPGCPTLEEMREMASILERAEKSSRNCQKKPSLEFPIKLPIIPKMSLGYILGLFCSMKIKLVM